MTSVVLGFFSCENSITNESYDKARVKKEVEAAVWAFHAADTAKNAAGVINLLWPEYTMLADGKRISYKDVAEGSKQFMSSLELFHTEWSDLEIIPISHDVAISSFIFKDSIISKSGELTKTHGPTTLLWQQRNGEWRALYGDSDHYSDF